MTATKPLHPLCRKCGWRKGGVDSWDRAACKCGHHEPAMSSCTTCKGYGKVPYNIGYTVCPNCDGSGLKA